jgi:UDP:flavonoid glycosyltransferase YjiC (YdhE family)
LLPLAQQAAQEGHDVLVTGAASLGAHATSRGLSFTATGPDLRPTHAPLTVHEVDEERRGVADYFVARLGRLRSQAVLDLCRSWRPHVVVRDEVDFGAAVAAEAAGLPHVPVVVIGAGGFILRALVSRPLDLLLSEFGVRNVTGFDMLHRHATLTPFPRSFRSPDDPLPGKVIGYHVPAPPRAARPRRSVFVTLGTIFNTESGDLLRVAALGAADCRSVERVVVATGEHVEPASLGQLPQQVEVHRFVQQEAVLSECIAVVSHAGSGTVLGALKQALPMVSLPMGADQQLNATRLQSLGLGISLRADTADVAQIRDSLSESLASSPMRQRLHVVRDEIEALPGPAEAMRAVVGLSS